METLEKAQERERILSEGHQLFAELKDKIFKELFDIISGKEDLKISDYCRIGFSEGYLKGYRKAKGEAPPAPKTNNPMPKILPGYLISVGKKNHSVIRKDPWGSTVTAYGEIEVHPKDVSMIWDERGIVIWMRD